MCGNCGPQSAKHMLPLRIFLHPGSDTLKLMVPLLPSQPRKEGMVFPGRQKTSPVGYCGDVNV